MGIFGGILRVWKIRRKYKIIAKYSQNAMIIVYLQVVLSNVVSMLLSSLYSVITRVLFVKSFQFTIIWLKQFLKLTLTICIYDVMD